MYIHFSETCAYTLMCVRLSIYPHTCVHWWGECGSGGVAGLIFSIHNCTRDREQTTSFPLQVIYYWCTYLNEKPHTYTSVYCLHAHAISFFKNVYQASSHNYHTVVAHPQKYRTILTTANTARSIVKIFHSFKALTKIHFICRHTPI